MPKPISQVITTNNQGHYLSPALKSLLNPSQKFLTACLFSLVASLLPSIAASQPIAEPGSDSTGTVVSEPVPNQFNIGVGTRSGNNLFHSFVQFNLGSGQIANFIADPSIANILGRVTSGNASVIDGIIQVTGGNANLFLMNPAGILFGDGARLSIPGAFTATTATRIGFDNNNGFNAIGPNDYSALIGNPSTFDFGISGTPGAIVNSGQLAVKEGQNLTLIGGVVVSTNELTAPGGNITIAAVPGQNLVRISQDGHLLNLEIQPSTTDASPITPLSLPQLLTGNNNNPAPVLVTGLTVNNTEQVVRTSSDLVVPESAGTVVISGTVDAATTTPSLNGGSIQLLGNLVGLVDNALVNASGDAGGGRVLLSSESRGEGTAPNSSRIFVGPGVAINADASSTGNGGQVSVQSDGTTRFYGNINALGAIGAIGSNGGSVEISAQQNLSFNGIVDTLVVGGSRGTLSLSSADLSIIDAALDPSLVNNPQILFDPTPDPASNTLSWGQIAALAPNNNIILAAMGEIAIADVVGNTPNVTQNNLVNLVNLDLDIGNLTIRSTEGSITFEDTNDAIATQDSALILEAGDSITVGNLTTNGGVVTLGAQNNITIDSIDTRSPSGTGGNVDITTERFFRASGQGASIDTAGRVQGGSITIRHGGGTFGVPFRVGSNYNDTNGTAGSISTGSDEISSGVFYGGYEEGNFPSNIQIITPKIDSRVLPPLLVGNPQAQPDAANTNNFTSPSLPPVEIDTIFAPLEESFTRQFEQYFGTTVDTPNTTLTQVGGTSQPNEANPPNTSLTEPDETSQPREAGTPNTTLTQARETLQQVEQQTGLKPALLYAVFVPATISLDASTEEQVPLPTDELELILVTAEGKPIRRRVKGTTRQQVLKIAQEFRSSVTNVRRPRSYLNSAQQLYSWLVAPLAVDLQAQNIDNLVFLMDTGLRSIPLAALHDGQGFLIERYSVSLMPSLRLTDTRYRDIKEAQVLAMGAEKFADQKPLPAVPLELSLITGQLWRGKSFLNDAFTLENLKAQRQRTPFGIIHLATHANFQPGAPDKSYIQLTNSKLRLSQLPQLGWNNPPVELLVLSACRTALGDEQAELGFAGLAVQAGVKSALASLWYVSDEATLGLMSQFYGQLNQSPSKAEALRQAQLAMLNGQVRIESGNLRDARGELQLPPALAGLQDKELTHPYYWAAFTMIGNPW